MPLYEVHHCTPLDKSQRDNLAEAITHIHTRKFVTPGLFVNVRFVDVSAEHNYIAGKERAINRILAYVRTGGSRTTANFDDLAQQVQDAWDRIMVPRASTERQLNRVFVMGAITTGVENGFLLPRAGRDVEWLQANYAKFEELAQQGDGDFVGLVEELQSRPDLSTALAGKTS
ncbi:hypothetical protein BJX76DRAFT_128293 [Aspergillus varians]